MSAFRTINLSSEITFRVLQFITWATEKSFCLQDRSVSKGHSARQSCPETVSVAIRNDTARGVHKINESIANTFAHSVL